jgi:hypothetical protein
MPLRYVADDLGDRAHDELDRLFFEQFGLTSKLLPRLPPPHLPTLLSMVVEALPLKLDQRLVVNTASKLLLDETPELEDFIQNAWASANLRSIRNLGKLVFM